MNFVLFALVIAAAIAAPSQQCVTDLHDVLNDLITVGTDIGQASHACSTNETTCNEEIAKILADFGNVTIDLTNVAKDCFGASQNGTLCAKQVSILTEDIAQEGQDLQVAITACQPRPVTQECLDDLNQLGKDTGSIVLAITETIAICSFNSARQKDYDNVVQHAN